MRRIIGLVLLTLALATVIWEGVDYLELGEWRLMPFGEAAFRLAPEWLNLMQAIIQRYVFAWLWDPVIQTFLLWPIWPVLGGLGLVLLAFRRKRRPR